MIRSLLLLALSFGLAACTATQPFVARTEEAARQAAATPPEAPLAYRVFLIGDAGEAAEDEPALGLLARHLAEAGEDAAVVFLGDHLYGEALPDSGAVGRRAAEQRLGRLLAAVEGFEGRVIFLPGDRDWRGGPEALRRLERFVEAALDRGNTFLPDDGLPGPVEVKLTDTFRLAVLDTQWWLTGGPRPYGEVDDYDIEEDADFLLALDDVIRRRDDETLLVVGHHPLVSNGRYGGHFPLKDHLFPLAAEVPGLYVPLPVVGSLYPLYGRFVGRTRQDLASPRYDALRTALGQTFALHERLVYAAAHERNLQFFREATLEGEVGHVVSGGGSSAQPVLKGRGAGFAYAGTGFAVLDYFADGSLHVRFLRPQEGGEEIFAAEVFGPSRDLIDPVPAGAVEVPVSYADSSVTRAVNPAYQAGPVRRFFLGPEHRDAWATPVTVPVLDLSTFAGGLEVEKRGGGQQTISLRLDGADGHEYVLRSIDKDPSLTVPPNLQGTIATDLVQDQIASIHPFGAFIIPRLAEAAGVYHTKPQLVFVPDDPRLGRYRDEFAGQIMMIEERPDDDLSDRPNFGNSREVISASAMYEEITEDNDHRVDARAFLRARLFDMWLSDWDRHRDQWRWASFEPYELDPALDGDARTQGKIYRPIPRDRDFAFNRLDGFFTRFAGYFDPKFQDFEEDYGLLTGLTLNGLHQDRRLLASLTREDFAEIAGDLQARLTDEVIEEALRAWPAPIQEIDADEFARLLKIRRDKLAGVAEEFYELHARIVDVVGSNKHERFEVTRGEGTTEVVVYKTSKDGDVRRELYRRTFHTDETDEVRLYGLDGNDTFVITGAGGRGIRVRAVGGPGDDAFAADARGGGVHLYDTRTGTTFETTRAAIHASDLDPAVNGYDPAGYAHDLWMPVAFFGGNNDDGVFVGGGVKRFRQGFRKTPYATMHEIKANFAAKTLAFNVVYGGHFVEVLGPWDVVVDAAYRAPNNIRNFYGLGNETENTERDREFYQARLTQGLFAPALFRTAAGGASLRLGPRLEFTDVRENDGRFVNEPQPGISDRTFETQVFGGLDAEVAFDLTDDPVNPKQGVRWRTGAALNAGLVSADDTFGRLTTDFAFYVSPSLKPQLTLAGRAGVAHNIGSFPFYAASTLGGRDNLRGYRSTRFAGRTSLYQNAEARLELFDFSTYLAIGHAGVLAFLDNGRVFIEDDPSTPTGTSNAWHQGYGGGLWTELFDVVVLTATAGFSPDDTTVGVQLGFQF